MTIDHRFSPEVLASSRRHPPESSPLQQPQDQAASMTSYATGAMKAGSSSFNAAARLFDDETRHSTVLLYAWCRHCDDVVDGQTLGHGQREGDREGAAEALDQLRAATQRACDGVPDDHPVFQGLAEVVRRHALPSSLLFEHLDGFEMDVRETRYATFADTLLYCYRVAGVVGIMMAHMMGTRDPATLDRACDLGMAFQLTNIARDIVEDAAIGRVYCPQAWLDEAGIEPGRLDAPENREALAEVAKRLVQSADPYYQSALRGLGALPLRSAWSVATARDVYRAIGRKVRDLGSHAWDRRVSTTTLDKLWFVARGAAVALATRSMSAEARPDGLWQRPH